MTNALRLALCLALLFGGMQLFSSPAPNTITVAGPTNSQPIGRAWGVTMCPQTGGSPQSLAFIAHAGVLGAGTARVIIENDTNLTSMCALDVPCGATPGATYSVECDAGLSCVNGDVVHIEWTSTDCSFGALPSGAGAGVLVQAK